MRVQAKFEHNWSKHIRETFFQKTVYRRPLRNEDHVYVISRTFSDMMQKEFLKKLQSPRRSYGHKFVHLKKTASLRF